MNNALYEQAEHTVALLKAKSLTISTAESCTGGMVSSFITSVSGVSSIFELGITSYSCKIKNRILGVENETLERLGAVSEDTARQMAQRVRLLAEADIGVSVTGVAGPDGSEGHNPGFAFIAAADREHTVVRQLQINPKSRNFVRETIVSAVFELINDFVEG